MERHHGLVIPCMIHYMDNVTSKQCRELLDRMESLVFTDYQLVYKFVEHCQKDIDRLQCGRTTVDDDKKDEVPHTHTCTDHTCTHTHTRTHTDRHILLSQNVNFQLPAHTCYAEH